MSILGIIGYWAMINPVLASIWAAVIITVLFGVNNMLLFRWLKNKLKAILDRCAGIEGKISSGDCFAKEVGTTFS